MILGFAIDHRSQFEDMAQKTGADLSRVGDFKLLALNAIHEVAAGRSGFGTLLDERFGKKALHAAMEGDLWVARPIEKPGSRPLEFEPGLDIGGVLREWPIDQVVKCLVSYHPDDPIELKEAQEKQMLTLFEATQRSGHELLLEIICGPNGPMETDTVARALSRLYDLGLKPDWWKLEAQSSDDAWQATCNVIKQRDPYCRGIVLLGLDAPMDDLLASFEIASHHDLVKGFTIGRTIFGDVALNWLANKINDAEAQKQMAERFKKLANSWLALREK